MQYTDVQLLSLLQSDAQQGLAALLDTYGAVVNAVVYRVLPNDPQDAEECVADVMVAAWRSADRLTPDNLRGWLCVTARNAALNRYRALKAHTADELDETIASDWMLERRSSDLEDAVQALVDALPPPDREIFIRKYYLLETSREIGRRLNLQERTVNTRLSRGRARLRSQLEEMFPKGGTRYASQK